MRILHVLTGQKGIHSHGDEREHICLRVQIAKSGHVGHHHSAEVPSKWLSDFSFFMYKVRMLRYDKDFLRVVFNEEYFSE